MLRVDPLFNLNAASNLNRLAGQESTLTSELSSGLRVSSASDDPAAAAASVRMGSKIAQDDTFVQTASSLESRLQTADSALSSVVTQVTSAITLGVEGTNGTLTASNLQAIAQQLTSIRDQVVSLANTSYNGTYVFGGTSDTQPYASATSGYAGDADTQFASTPTGQKIATTMDGSSIFSSSNADLLGSLNNLIADFSAGTASSSSTTDLNTLRSALDVVTTQRGVLAASTNALSAASTYASTEITNLTAGQSSLVSADTTKVATDLSTTETQEKALLSAATAVNKYSLFDYM
ncbi:flagellar hook-associated protein 3 [Granulicella cerasi]|uniref:Flagellar hook-associated protein 3 n=1 Tax=Granulicella cerasi TaxID=741063 RepID=A0ABW1Z5Q8_9BACT|nr:flagellar hook-associated protein 3 [Granulicella cerasi]